MNKIEEVKQVLFNKDASLVVCYKSGEIKEYYQDRINDIKDILTTDKNALEDAIIADKVIGKVAASILAVAGVKEIFAKVISNYAIPVLEEYNIKYEYDEKVDYIINQTKTGMCPMENKYKDEMDIQKIYDDMIKS